MPQLFGTPLAQLQVSSDDSPFCPQEVGKYFAAASQNVWVPLQRPSKSLFSGETKWELNTRWSPLLPGSIVIPARRQICKHRLGAEERALALQRQLIRARQVTPARGGTVCQEGREATLSGVPALNFCPPVGMLVALQHYSCIFWSHSCCSSLSV